MELYLVRHGQSANNRRTAQQADRVRTTPEQRQSASSPELEPRIADPPLTDLGERQAHLAGEWLKGEEITRLYCGPMLRTLQTARIIGGSLELAPRVCVALHEWGGLWEERGEQGSVQLPGLARAEMGTVFPGFVLPDEVTEQGWWFHDWEGDRAMLQLAHRNALSFIAHLETHYGGSEQRIAAILHGGSGSSVLGALFNVPQDVRWYARFTHDNTGVSRISITPEHRQMRYLNRVDHLRLLESGDEAAPPVYD